MSRYHFESHHDIPCAAYNIDMRWPSAASALVDFDSPCEVVPYFEDRARRENTYHGVALDNACRDGPVEGEVELPSRRVLMENFRRQVGEVPVRDSVSNETGRRRQR